MHIGVFDSGRGGEFVAEKFRLFIKGAEFTVINDMRNAPYGNKNPDEVKILTDKAIYPLLDKCDIIVIACNTATAAAIDYLREKYPSKKFIGFEPMIKTACSTTKSNHITLLATYATSNSARTQKLIDNFASNTKIDVVDTTGWATNIDKGSADNIDLSGVTSSISSGSDTIVIGCTHYIALVDRLSAISNSVSVLEPSLAVGREIIRQYPKLQRRTDLHDQHSYQTYQNSHLLD